ncbi:hypothetical protein PLCT2_01057 [Planctomycetaceae bacterium]|nr:hypothetical protein PLCT2_01057 [Planctomycetaceae bacterium]
MTEEKTLKVKYVPPTLEVIDQVAKAVCEQLAAENPGFRPPEVVQDLAAFLSVVARIHAAHLNRQEDALEALDTKAQSA